MAVGQFQCGELDIGPPQGREIPVEDRVHPLPFADGLRPAHFAQRHRSGWNHLAVKRKNRLHELGLDGRADPLGYTPRQVQP